MKTYLIAASGLRPSVRRSSSSRTEGGSPSSKRRMMPLPSDAMPSPLTCHCRRRRRRARPDYLPLLSPGRPHRRPRPARLGEIINSEAKNRRKIGFGGGRGTREGGRCDGGLFVCLTVSRGECTRRCRILESVWLRCRSDGGGKPRGDATKAQRFLRASWPRNLHH